MKKNFLWFASMFLVLNAAYAFAQSEEYGLASYYSDKYHGRPTASGELYDKDQLTAAHKTFPYGTMIRITRLDNKKSVVCRVNDRGPYVSGRVVDVSGKAAQQLGLIVDGTTRVKVELVEQAKETPATTKTTPKTEDKVTAPKTSSEKPAAETKKPTEKPKEPAKTSTPAKTDDKSLANSQTFTQYGLYKIEISKPEKKGFGVQVASLSSYDNAMKQIADLQGKWFKNVLLSIEPGKEDRPVYKIILGPFDDKESAESYKKSIKKKNNLDGFVISLGN